MDRIDFSAISVLNPFLFKKQEPSKTKEKENLKGNRKTFFSDLIENAYTAGEMGPLRTVAPSEEALTELMDAVHSAGSDLIDRPFHDEILRYKRAVRDFVNYVVENGFTVERFKTRRRGKETMHVQIQVIDRKLEELAAAILSGQSKQLERVSKLDEITGLLVDLTITGVIKERDE